MWLSKRKETKSPENYTGQVTISGEKCAVLDFTEHRDLSVYAPGGYFWLPSAGDEVLVFKESGIMGKPCENLGLKPGEVCIRSVGGAEIRLCNDGNIYLKGNLVTEGETQAFGDETFKR